jgi:hypothetical protein
MAWADEPTGIVAGPAVAALVWPAGALDGPAAARWPRQPASAVAVMMTAATAAARFP